MNFFFNYLNEKPNKVSEESVLISTYFMMCRVKSNWYLNTINPPGGEWNELKLKKKNEIISRSLSKSVSRLDLILQKEKTFILGEAKEKFASIVVKKENEKINKTFKEQKKYIEDILGYKISPIYLYISALQDNSEMNEVKLIKRHLDNSEFSNRIVSLLVLRKNSKIKLVPIFANNADENIKKTFTEIFS